MENIFIELKSKNKEKHMIPKNEIEMYHLLDIMFQYID